MTSSHPVVDPIVRASGSRQSRLRPIARAKLLILLAAFISFLLSVYLWFAGQTQSAIFVGLWVPSILGVGVLMTCGYGAEQ